VLEFLRQRHAAERIARWVAQRWQDKPVEVWVMNYPGYAQRRSCDARFNSKIGDGDL